MAIKSLGNIGKGGLAVDDRGSPSGIATLVVTSSAEAPVRSQDVGPSEASTYAAALSAAEAAIVRPANQNRRGASLFNSTTTTLYLLLGAGNVTPSFYTVLVAPSGYFEVPFAFRGTIRGILAEGEGEVLITEYSG